MQDDLVLELVKGTARDFPLQVQSPDGTVPVNVYLPSDVLSATIYAGDGQPPLLTPFVQWLDVINAKYQLTFNASDTAGLDTATYRVIVGATRSGRFSAFAPISLSLLPNTGSDPAIAVYCTYRDMIQYAPFLSKLQDAESYFEGWATQRGMARTWLENIIQKHYRLNAGTGLTTFGNSIVSFGPRRLGGDNQILQGYLDANKLMTAPPKRVTEITAKYAIGLACQEQVTGADPRSAFYQVKSDWYFQEAYNTVQGYIAEIDINGDGFPEYTIPCGTTDALYA